MLFLVSPAAALLTAGILVLWFSRRRWLGVALTAVGVVVLAGAVYVQFAYKAYRIPSESMTPTVDVDDRLLIKKGQEADVGDIVVFHPPAGATNFEGPQCGDPIAERELCARPAGPTSDINFIKRIVAVGGDRVGLRNGHVIRNGEPLDEPYVRECANPDACDYPAEITVPDGHVYLLGDNRGESDDSRFWGAVPEDAIFGKAVYRYWPTDKLGGL